MTRTTMLNRAVPVRYRTGARLARTTSTTSAEAAARATPYTTHFSCSRSTGPERRQRTRSARNWATVQTWKTMFVGTASTSSPSGRKANPGLVGYALKYSSEPEHHSRTNSAHHHLDGGHPEGNRITAVHRALTETTQKFISSNTGPSGSPAYGTPVPRTATPDATPATIRHQPTGLEGWRRVIG